MPIFRLNTTVEFPPAELAEPDGLLAVGGDLSIERLLEAYRLGIFPWYTEGSPLLWWSPAPRLILLPREFHLPRRVARSIRKQNFTVTADTAFSLVIEKCAECRGKNRESTWITAAMKNAYIRLHELGYAHSIECWQKNMLAGGLYGVALDRIFFGESMFSAVTDASKIAFHALVQHATATNIRVIDCQIRTEHLVRFGAREISRKEFQLLLRDCIRSMRPQKKWRLHWTEKEEIGPAGACREERKR
ncbi:MAG: leucyl/phenylalanyl-tRNA--protein transferase [Desulfobulbaceae bacterium]|nr:leucyl/phenylalanyl-tRNA--protein transferase [Desulfobulbaceae bacterium]